MTRSENLIRPRISERDEVPEYKRRRGSVKGKHPVVMDGGRLIVFIDDPAREEEIREKYKF